MSGLWPQFPCGRDLNKPNIPLHICFSPDQHYGSGLDVIRKGDVPISFLFLCLREKEVRNRIKDNLLILENGFLNSFKHYVHFFLITEKQCHGNK